MLQVLIVDDDMLIRTGLCHRIPWGTYDMEVAAEADSVSEAIAILKRIPIDIVFSDIVMPGGTGLDLLRYLQANRPDITAAVLSYHDEFSYAQQAMRLGAVDYIIKSVFDGPDIDRSMTAIREHCLHHRREHLQQPSDSSAVFSAAIAIADMEKKPFHLAPDDRSRADGYYFVSPSARLLTYAVPPEQDYLLELENRYGNNCVLLSFDVSQTTAADLMLAVNLFLSRDLYYEYLPHLSVYRVDARAVLVHQGELSGPDYVTIEHELSTMQWIWNEDGLKMLLHTIKNARLLASTVYNLFYCVQTQWKNYFPQDDIPNMFPLSGIHYWYQWIDYLNNFRTFVTTRRKLSKYSLDVISSVQELMLWIDDNFMQDIPLQSAADRAHLSTSYLSRCFKDITGRTFSCYIQQTRINYAKRMLKQSSLPIRRIAELCGFQDQFYFDKVFKKVVGQTPGKYRNEQT